MWGSFQMNTLIKASCPNQSKSLPDPEAHLTESEMLKLKCQKHGYNLQFCMKVRARQMLSLLPDESEYVIYPAFNTTPDVAVNQLNPWAGCYARCYER